MKLLFKIAFFALFSSIAIAQNNFITGIRSNKAIVQQYANEKQIEILNYSAEEFGNGNTFLRLNQDVAGAIVKIIIPTRLDSNGLFETLDLIFTLKKNKAASITVAFESDTPSVTIDDLKTITNIESWLSTAGAQFLSLNGNLRKIKTFKLKTRSISPNSNIGIVDLNHLSLSEELGKLYEIENIKNLSKQTISGKQIKLVAPLALPVNKSFFTILLTLTKLRLLGAAQVDLITPYLPYARSDKVDQRGVAVTGRLVAELMESSGADTVTFMRAHAPQSEGFFKIPTTNLSGRATISEYLTMQKIDVIISPDAGFQKDATLYADELQIPVAVINKQRDPITSETKILGISGVDVRGKVLAIVDDETASGGTLGKAAEYLISLGAKKVFAVVTHLTGNSKAALESEAVTEVVVTNSVPVSVSHPKLKVLSIAKELVESFEKLPENKNSCEQLF